MIRFSILVSYEVRSDETQKVDEMYHRFKELVESEFQRPLLRGTHIEVETLYAPPKHKRKRDE